MQSQWPKAYYLVEMDENAIKDDKSDDNTAKNLSKSDSRFTRSRTYSSVSSLPLNSQRRSGGHLMRCVYDHGAWTGDQRVQVKE